MEFGGDICKLFKFFLFGHVSCQELKLWTLQWKLSPNQEVPHSSSEQKNWYR